MKQRPQVNRGGRRAVARRRRWQFSLLALLVLTTVSAVLLSVGGRFPLESTLALAVFIFAAICVAMYVGELVIVGWIMDFCEWIVTPISGARPVPLEYEQLGEVTVVMLSNHIVTPADCKSVAKQLDRLVAEQHCDFILDFSGIDRLASSFRDVMLHVVKAAQNQAERLGKFGGPVVLPPGEVFKVFGDRQSAIDVMGRHVGHGWVVLCCVPAGIRAVSEDF